MYCIANINKIYSKGFSYFAPELKQLVVLICF